MDSQQAPPPSFVLYAAAQEIGRACYQQNKTFLQCKAEDEDPEHCLQQGVQVQRCVIDLLRDIQATCPRELEAFSACLARQPTQEYALDRCRQQQGAFARCRRAERPEHGAE